MRKLISMNAVEITIGTGYKLTKPGTIYIGSGGTLKCTLQNMTDGEYVSYTNIPDGTNFPRVVKYIHSDSTVSDIVADID